MSCTIHHQALPYLAQLGLRPLEAIDLVVVHCTELPDLAMARHYAEQVHYADGTGNSGHYYLDRDGAIYGYVPPERIAHHVRGYNPRSIGIELVNRGRYPDWFDSRCQHMDEVYPTRQIEALQWLLAELRSCLPGLRHIAGHQELDRELVAASDDAQLQVARKLDPGPLFPWATVLPASGLQRLGS